MHEAGHRSAHLLVREKLTHFMVPCCQLHQLPETHVNGINDPGVLISKHRLLLALGRLLANAAVSVGYLHYDTHNLCEGYFSEMAFLIKSSTAWSVSVTSYQRQQRASMSSSNHATKAHINRILLRLKVGVLPARGGAIEDELGGLASQLELVSDRGRRTSSATPYAKSRSSW